VQSQGQRSAPVVIPVVPATPAIFTTDASGKGQGAILNQDSSINSATNPAVAGSVVVLYGTGGGILTSDSPARLALSVSATIGGIDAPVLYAGIAPGLVSGAIQVNVQVPTGVPSGAVPVILQVGDARSRSDVTLAIQ
jgi:trimeric autotransporter adhesin